MALRATSPLTADHNATPRPVKDSFSFEVEVVDRRATAPTIRTLELVLAAGNDLSFVGGSKSVSQDVTVGAAPVSVSLAGKRITGLGDGLASFRVTLREQGGSDLVFCLIRID